MARRFLPLSKVAGNFAGVARRRGVALLCLLLANVSLPTFADPDASPSVGDLKQLSLEELMNLEVTSVSKQRRNYCVRRPPFR